MSSLTPTEVVNTRNSGTRLFYQVTPSGATDHTSVMKLDPVPMLPGKSIQTQTLAAKKIKGTGNLTPVRLCVTPVTVPRQNVNVTTYSEIKLQSTDLPHSAQINTFITTSPTQASQSGTTTIIPKVSLIQTKPHPSATPVTLIGKVRPEAQRINIKANAKVLSNKPLSHSTVFFASPVTCVNQTAQVTVKVQVAPTNLAKAQSTVVYVSPPKSSPTSCTESNRIRTFSNVTKTSFSDYHKPQTTIPHFPPRSSSPIKWVVEEGRPLPTSPSPSSPPSVISPIVSSKGLQVVAKQEQSNKSCKTTRAQVMVGETKMMGKNSEYTVVMYNNKVFFRVKKNKGTKDESQELRGQSEVINLCDEILDSKEKAYACPDEDNVEFVAYIPGQTNSSPGERTTEKASQTRTSPEVDGRDQHNSAERASSYRKSKKRKSHSIEISTCVSAAPCPVADRKLQRTFGITSELRINLCRIQVNSSDTDRSCLTQIQPLDYTEPIDEDFLCSQICPTVTASSSRVSRTRKRTKCPCCSPAALHRHHVQSRRSKPGGGERRDATRKLFKLQPTLVTAVENSSSRQDMDSEELQIHQQIQLLREALRLKEAALQQLKNNKNC